MQITPVGAMDARWQRSKVCDVGVTRRGYGRSLAVEQHCSK
jgi:hypothetical protein